MVFDNRFLIIFMIVDSSVRLYNVGHRREFRKNGLAYMHLYNNQRPFGKHRDITRQRLLDT